MLNEPPIRTTYGTASGEECQANLWLNAKGQPLEFIRRFLQHVLRTGFMKIHYYGFLNPNCSVPLEKISTLIQMAYAFAIEMLDYPESPPKTPICPQCGGTLRYMVSFIPGLTPQLTFDSS